MGAQIEKYLVDSYNQNIQHLSQQTESKLGDKIRREVGGGKTAFFAQLGQVKAVRKTTRNGDTPLCEPQHARRANYLTTLQWATLVDATDKVEALADPTSAYAQAAVFAMNRAKDEEIIAAATGTAQAALTQDAAEDGPTKPVELPASQKIAADTGGKSCGLTLEKLIAAKSKISKKDLMRGAKLYFAHTQQQLDDLLTNVQQVSSSDYASVKALVDGNINYFMGMEFVKTELLDLEPGTDVRTCFAFVEYGLLGRTGAPIESRIDQRADKSYATQVYSTQMFGANRMEEELVAAVYCDESPSA